MGLQFLKTERRWIWFRVVISFIFSLAIILIGKWNIDLYFYTWIFAFMNVIISVTLSLLMVLYTVPIFRDKDFKGYTSKDKLYSRLVILVGFVIFMSNVIGILTLPPNFHPVYHLNSERIIRLIFIILVCGLCYVGDTTYTSYVTDRFAKLKRHLNPKDDFTISTQIETERHMKIISVCEKILIFLSCYLEALFISGVFFVVISVLHAIK